LAASSAFPRGAMSSRDHALVRQGKIQPSLGVVPTPGSNHSHLRSNARWCHLTPVRDQDGCQAGSARTPLPIERGPSVRWNLHLSARLRERIKAMVGARGLQNSQMVEELLWLALAVVEESSITGVG
jgi:hypothetical protein